MGGHSITGSHGNTNKRKRLRKRLRPRLTTMIDGGETVREADGVAAGVGEAEIVATVEIADEIVPVAGIADGIDPEVAKSHHGRIGTRTNGRRGSDTSGSMVVL